MVAAATSDLSATTPAGIDQVIPTVSAFDATYATGGAVDSALVFPDAANNPMLLHAPEILSYLLITALFVALMMRTNQVEDAVRVRTRMQEEVRLLKLREMGEGRVSPERTQRTLQRYEDAVRKEESLRTILPGVRISPPGAKGRKEEEARDIARRYLGREFNIGVPERQHETSPRIALGVAAAVALGQMFLMLAYMM